MLPKFKIWREKSKIRQYPKNKKCQHLRQKEEVRRATVNRYKAYNLNVHNNWYTQNAVHLPLANVQSPNTNPNPETGLPRAAPPQNQQ